MFRFYLLLYAFERILSVVYRNTKKISKIFSREHLLRRFKRANHETRVVNYEGKPTWIRIFYQILKIHILHQCMDVVSDIHEENNQNSDFES